MDKTTLDSTIVHGSTCGTGDGAGEGVMFLDGTPGPVNDENRDEKNPPPLEGLGSSCLG